MKPLPQRSQKAVDTITVDLQRIKDRLPPALAAYVDEYAPQILALTAEQTKQWLDLARKGDLQGAYQSLIKSMGADELIRQQQRLNDELRQMNYRNYAAINLQRKAAVAFMEVLLGIALAAVSF